MEAGDCPPLNINAMRAISVKSYLIQLRLCVRLSVNLYDLSEVLPHRTFYINFHVRKIPCFSMENLGQKTEHFMYSAGQN